MFRYSVTEFFSLAEKTQQTVDKLLKTLLVLEEIQQEREDQRRASPEEKEKIDRTAETVDGTVTAEMKPGELITMAGVRKNPGTVRYAKKAIEVLLIKHHKTT
jgi:hypothetical protein